MKKTLLIILQMIIVLTLNACVSPNKNESVLPTVDLNEIDSENHSAQSSVESGVIEVDISLDMVQPYLELLGTYLENDDFTISQALYDNMSSVNIMDNIGTVSYQYAEINDEKMVNSLTWVSNEKVPEVNFNNLIETLNIYMGHSALSGTLNLNNKMQEAYLWNDLDNLCRICSWYNEEYINLCWEYDSNLLIEGMDYDIHEYADIPSTIMDERFKKILTFYDLDFNETWLTEDNLDTCEGIYTEDDNSDISFFSRYNVGEATFLEQECNVLLWYKGIPSSDETAGVDVPLFVEVDIKGYDFNSLKEKVKTVFKNEFSEETSDSFSINIPTVALELKVNNSPDFTMFILHVDKYCIADNCSSYGRYRIKGISGEIEYYCKEHYQEMQEIVQDMMEDLSAITCEVDECDKAGIHEIIGLSGMKEYYCEEHYQELESLIDDMLNDVGN